MVCFEIQSFPLTGYNKRKGELELIIYNDKVDLPQQAIVFWLAATQPSPYLVSKNLTKQILITKIIVLEERALKRIRAR